MSKLKKSSIIVVSLLIIPLLFSVIVDNQEVGQFSFVLLPFTQYPLIGEYAASYLFWGSSLIFVLVIVLILIVLFYPHNRTSILFKKGKSELRINQKAITHFVQASLAQEQFIDEPKVKTKMTKHKLKIYIEGTLKETTNVSEKYQLAAKDIENKLQNLLGITEEKQVKVNLKNFESTKAQAKKRVN